MKSKEGIIDRQVLLKTTKSMLICTLHEIPQASVGIMPKCVAHLTLSLSLHKTP